MATQQNTTTLPYKYDDKYPPRALLKAFVNMTYVVDEEFPKYDGNIEFRPLAFATVNFNHKMTTVLDHITKHHSPPTLLSFDNQRMLLY